MRKLEFMNYLLSHLDSFLKQEEKKVHTISFQLSSPEQRLSFHFVLGTSTVQSCFLHTESLTGSLSLFDWALFLQATLQEG